MPTLQNCFDELRARRKRLKEAEDGGWRDCIPSERAIVAEFEGALVQMLLKNADRLVAVAGELALGELPLGMSLAFSDQS